MNLVRVVISRPFLEQIPRISPGLWVRISQGVPADAELVQVSVDPLTLSAHLVFKHASFRDLAPGEFIPEFPVIVDTKREMTNV